jgi:hypothetical protein
MARAYQPVEDQHRSPSEFVEIRGRARARYHPVPRNHPRRRFVVCLEKAWMDARTIDGSQRGRSAAQSKSEHF